MAKFLNGKELSLFIKERQAKEVRSLKQSKNIHPRLAIIRTNPNPVTDLYVSLKARYAEDIGVAVDIVDCLETGLEEVISRINENNDIHGVILQLPLSDSTLTDKIVNLIKPSKDVDGLGDNAQFDAATPTAINWLLAGYNVDLVGKQIVIVGAGKLVGSPLAKIWLSSGYSVTVVTSKSPDKDKLIKEADVIVSATGKPGIITSDMVKTGATVVDAGVATDKNGLVGDVSNEVRLREDVAITPEKGGVGPLTVSALFHNLLLAARKSEV